jgi:chloride channel protein, CIC family
VTTAGGRSIEGFPLRSHVVLWAVAIALGSVTAFGVWLFNKAIDGVGSVVSDALVPALAPIGAWSIVPILALAGLLVAGIVRFLKPEKLAAMGHIIDGVAEHDGHLDNRNAAVTIAGAAVGLGMGVPVGADTPSAMIGGHLGSWVALRLGWPTVFVQSLIVAGVAAGISATFLAQLSAVFFGLEVVLGGIGGLVFIVPTLLAVAASAVTTFRLTGTPPVYAIPLDAVHWDLSLLLYLLPALVTAVAAVAYVRLFPLLKGAWAKVEIPTWARMAVAGAVVGVVAVALPGVTGSGTATMKQLFGGATIPLATLLALALAKLLLTPGSLGSGFVGGVIGPAMLIGSTLGAAVGTVVIPLFPGLGLSPVIFAMVGTTAMLSGSLHAPLFAALIVFEMAGAYEMLVPLMMAAAIGYGLAAPFQAGSVYTFGFGKLGIRLWPGRFRTRADARNASSPDSPAGCR